MSDMDIGIRAYGLAGIWPGDNRLSARIGDRLRMLPGRWRWSIERLLGWWLGELSAIFRLAPPKREAVTIAEAEILQFSFATSPDTLSLIRERIALMVEERTPFTIDEILAAYRLENDGGEVKVLVRIVPIAHLETVLPEDGARAIMLAGAGGSAMMVRMPITLLEPALRDIHRRRERRRKAVAAAILLSLLSVLVVPIWARRQAIAREQAAMEQERAVLAPLIRRTAAARARERAAADAMRIKAAASSPLPLLDHLTRRIGDDSYLTEFRLAEREGAIAGFTTQASALPGPLEADPLLANVRLTGPVSRDGRDGRQRFEIAFRVAG